MRRGLKIGIGAAVSVLLVAALYIFYTFDPEIQPLFPKCPFLLATGYECPGCGSQRAVHSLLHLKIVSAFRQNGFVVLTLPYIFFGVYLEYGGGKKRFPGIDKMFYGKWAAVILLTLIFFFWIGRNIW